MIANEQSRLDLISHPIRLRVIGAVAGRSLTTEEIGRVLEDVPQASLYRHVQRLLEGGVLEVVEEHAVRGAKERVFALATSGGRIRPEDLQRATPEDHERSFFVFIAGLLSNVRDYISSRPRGPLRPGVGCTGVTAWLTENEAGELRENILALMKEAARIEPLPSRSRYRFALVALPSKE